jgi:hypothetical protein
MIVLDATSFTGIISIIRDKLTICLSVYDLSDTDFLDLVFVTVLLAKLLAKLCNFFCPFQLYFARYLLHHQLFNEWLTSSWYKSRLHAP